MDWPQGCRHKEYPGLIRDNAKAVIGRDWASGGICYWERECPLYKKLFIYVSHQFGGQSLKEVGDHFSMRGSAVSQSSRRFKARISEGKGLQKIVGKVRKCIGGNGECCRHLYPYFNPFSGEEIKNRILQLVFEPDIYERYSRRGIEIAKKVAIKQDQMLDKLINIILN